MSQNVPSLLRSFDARFLMSNSYQYSSLVFIVSGSHYNVLIFERLFMHLRLNILAFVLPSRYIHKVLIISLSLALRCLALLSDVTSARLFTVKSIYRSEERRVGK